MSDLTIFLILGQIGRIRITRWPFPFFLADLGVGWAEIKPHLGGHWEYTQRLVTDQFELSNSLTSNRMLPHCGFEGLSTLGLKQQRTESPPPRARVRYDTERFRCYALSTAFFLFPWLALPSSSEQRPVRLLPFGSATFPSSFFLLPCSGHPTTCCCDRSLSAPCFVRA